MDRPASNRLRRGRFSEPGRIYLLTSTTKDRRPIFADFGAARCLPPPKLKTPFALLPG